MITCSNSLCRERDAQPSGRCSTSHHVRYRAVPRTNRTPSTANTRSNFATSSTGGLPACAPSLPWQCFCADASLSECTDVASPDCAPQLLEQPLPAKSATSTCLACCSAQAVPCNPWAIPSDSPPLPYHLAPHHNTDRHALHPPLSPR